MVWTCRAQHRLDCRSTQAECGCTEKIWQAKEIMGWNAWEWQKEARYGFCWPSKSFWVERTPSRKTCQKAQPSVEENRALKWIWWWWCRSVVSRYITRASRSWYSLLYNWPPNRDLLLNNSLLELIYFISKRCTNRIWTLKRLPMVQYSLFLSIEAFQLKNNFGFLLQKWSKIQQITLCLYFLCFTILCSCDLICCLTEFNWATSWENLFLPYANNRCADQPVHMRSLISAFVVCCLYSMICIHATSQISRL